jgi:hypothetical protein
MNFKDRQIAIRQAEHDLAVETQKLLVDLLKELTPDQIESIYGEDVLEINEYEFIHKLTPDYVIIGEHDLDDEDYTKKCLDDLSQEVMKAIIDYILYNIISVEPTPELSYNPKVGEVITTKKGLFDALEPYSDDDRVVVEVHDMELSEDLYRFSIDEIHMGEDREGNDRGFEIRICPIQHEPDPFECFTVCSNCGSKNVEIRVWEHQETGNLSGATGDDDDTWCNECEGHHGIEIINPDPEGKTCPNCGNPDVSYFGMSHGSEIWKCNGCGEEEDVSLF